MLVLEKRMLKRVALEKPYAATHPVWGAFHPGDDFVHVYGVYESRRIDDSAAGFRTIRVFRLAQATGTTFSMANMKGVTQHRLTDICVYAHQVFPAEDVDRSASVGRSV